MPSVAIIGAGRVGTALGIALARAGYPIKLLVAMHAAHARRAARIIGTNAVAFSKKVLGSQPPTVLNLLAKTELVLVATPDDAIESVVAQLAKVLGDTQHRATVVMHTSGALSSQILRPLKKHDAAVGSIHPLLSISDSVAGADNLSDAFFALEGDKRAVEVGRRLVRDVGGQSFTIKRQKKALYHAGALMASPNLAALLDIAIEMVSSCGVSRRRAGEILLPLVSSTIENLSRQEPAQALTGTFKRGDLATIRKHLAAIDAAGQEDALTAYVLLGRRSLKLAHHDRTRTREIEELLSRAAKSIRSSH